MRNFLDEAEDGSDEAGIDLTPMLDVTFIMLIFFIVTASFLQTNGFDISRTATNQDQQQEQVESDNILIEIESDGLVFINRRPVGLASLTANIKRLRAQNPEGKLIIKAAPKAQNGILIQIMDAAHKAGVYNVLVAND